MDYLNIQRLLSAANLSDTFPQIREKANAMGNYDIADEVENLWSTYQRMIQFTMRGINDPKAGEIRSSLCQKLSSAVTKMERRERLSTRKDMRYVSTARMMSDKQSFETIAENLEQASKELSRISSDDLLRDSEREYMLEKAEQARETALQNMFKWVWTSEPWHNNDVHQANRIMFSDHLSSAEKCVLVSAVSLSLLEYADKAKVIFLLDTYLIDDVSIAQRALVGMVLALLMDETGCYAYDESIVNHILTFREDETFVQDFFTVLAQLHSSSMTDKVSSKMLNDIMPVISGTILQKKKKTNQDIDIKELTKNGENPEWLKDEKFEKKIRQMSELQLEGADVYYSSFANMKGFSFFNEMSHWFYPFSMEEPLVPEQRKFISRGTVGKFAKIMLKSSPFCNSDKFSLLLTVCSFGRFDDSIVEEQIAKQVKSEEEMNELIEHTESMELKKEDVSRHYIFDLYRFYYSYPYKIQFANPFAYIKEHPVNPCSHPIFKLLTDNANELLVNYADMLMHKEFYECALAVYNNETKNEFDPIYASTWQKKGFCQQKLGLNDDACVSYTIANNLKPNSKWTLTHLANISLSLGYKKAAASFFTKLIEIEPENVKYMLNCAKCYIANHEKDMALPLLHKAHFLDEESVAIKIELGWCLILNKDFESARHIISQVDGNIEIQALLQIATGNKEDAFRLLKESNLEASDIEELKNKLAMLNEESIIDSTSATLLLDALKLNIDI